jgi:hypothetical protein
MSTEPQAATAQIALNPVPQAPQGGAAVQPKPWQYTNKTRWRDFTKQLVQQELQILNKAEWDHLDSAVRLCAPAELNIVQMKLHRDRCVSDEENFAGLDWTELPAATLRQVTESAVRRAAAEEPRLRHRFTEGIRSPPGVSQTAEKQWLSALLVQWFTKRWTSIRIEQKKPSKSPKRKAACDTCNTELELVCLGCGEYKARSAINVTYPRISSVSNCRITPAMAQALHPYTIQITPTPPSLTRPTPPSLTRPTPPSLTRPSPPSITRPTPLLPHILTV